MSDKADTSSDILAGLMLLAAAAAALLVVNFGGAEWYEHILQYKVTAGASPFTLTKTVHHWINDGLMALFFLLVGVEINREFRYGHLKTRAQAALPIAAALGGFLIPAAVYLGVTHNAPEVHHGWSVPTATDIAFAVAVVTMLRKHVPLSLRVFLLALAVVDDLLAIIVIALFYTADVIWMNLFLAIMGALLLMVKNHLKIRKLWVYVVVGFLMWLAVLESGVHATVAGVMIGFLLPLRPRGGKPSPAKQVEDVLTPWVNWLVLPLFAFANVGVHLRGLAWEDWIAPATLGIAAGLVVGKQLGVFGTVWGLAKLGWAKRPEGANWRQVYGVSLLCGIGFTMSLFIGALAFPPELQNEVRLGVLMGSVVSALLAIVVLVRR